VKRLPRIALRRGRRRDAPSLFALIEANRDAAHLLPRRVDELEAHAARFLVAASGRRIVACAELAPLSDEVAEIRSLVVEADARRGGLGTAIVQALKRDAAVQGFHTLCAFTHSPLAFTRWGFTVVPHLAVPEKIAADCMTCALFGRCGQFAMSYALATEAASTRAARTIRIAAAPQEQTVADR
jgi:N-acetylglutamate synthase-like GNAT family acetyltransferase